MKSDEQQLHWLSFEKPSSQGRLFGLRSDGAVFRYTGPTIDHRTREIIKPAEWERMVNLDAPAASDDDSTTQWVRWQVWELPDKRAILYAFRSDGAVFQWSQCPCEPWRIERPNGSWDHKPDMDTPPEP
jgi:hypothetical protein